jgi:hypothetical protein
MSKFDAVAAELMRRKAPLRLQGSVSAYQRSEAVYAILRSWGASDDVALAGMLRASGSEDPAVDSTANQHQIMRSLVGAYAERLDYLFSGIDVEDLVAIRAEKGAESRVAAGAEAGDRPSRLEADDMLTIHLAILAERYSCAEEPAGWLHHASVLAAGVEQTAIPFFSRTTRMVNIGDEERLIAAYLAAWQAPITEATAQKLRAAAADLPCVAEPLIVLALIAVARGEPSEAYRFASEAESLLLEWSTSWDKRLNEEQWQAVIVFVRDVCGAPREMTAFIGDFLTAIFLGVSTTPEALYVRLLSMKLLPTLSSDEQPANPPKLGDRVFADEDFESIPPRFADFIDGLLSENPKRTLATYPGLTAKPWWDASRFPLVAALETAAQEIAGEFFAIDPALLHAEAERIGRAGSWDVLILFERGRKREDRCAAFPLTTRIIEEHATLRTHAGLIYFSRLAPGTIVTPHRGPTNIRLRCHLGVKIPGNCGITVGNTEGAWETGKCIVFDDSFTHAVWNSSDQERVVLIVDMWHPDLDPREVELLSGLHRYGISVADSLQRYWAKNEAAAAGPVSVSAERLVSGLEEY